MTSTAFVDFIFEDDKNDRCDDATIEWETPGAYTVAVYLCDRAYGGPEEGGWYYDTGRLSVQHWNRTRVFATLAEAHAYQTNVQRDLEANENAGRPGISSVLSIGRYYADVLNVVPPRYYPETAPHYE